MDIITLMLKGATNEQIKNTYYGNSNFDFDRINGYGFFTAIVLLVSTLTDEDYVVSSGIALWAGSNPALPPKSLIK